MVVAAGSLARDTDAVPATLLAVAESPILAGGLIVDMNATALAVADIVGAGVAVLGADGSFGQQAAVSLLVAYIGALSAVGSVVAGMHAAGAARARVGAAAKQAVVAESRVRRMHAGSLAVAGVVGAGIAVIGAGSAR